MNQFFFEFDRAGAEDDERKTRDISGGLSDDDEQ